MTITQEYLKSRLHYDPNTGIFTWLLHEGSYSNVGVRNARFAGRAAGHVNKNGYVVIAIDRVGYKAHRLAWLYMTGEYPSRKLDTDHKDGNRANNAWNNLPLGTRAENQWNRSKQVNNKTGRKGVCWHEASQYWVAQIKVNKKAIHLGCFHTI